jgi:hypothetical protein
METEQTMARLLAEIRTGQEHMKEMMDANQAKAEANLKEILTRMDGNQERMNECLTEEIKSGQAEMMSTANAFQEKMDAWIANMRDDRKETMSCQLMTERVWTVKSQVRKNGIRSGTSGNPYGRGRSEIFGNNEEAAQGPACSCRPTRRAKGTDPRRLFILEEVGCHVLEGVPPCSSGMTQGKLLQENSDPGTLWIAAGIDRCRNEDKPQA